MDRAPDDTPTALTTYHLLRARQGDSTSLDWLVQRLSPLLVTQASVRLGPDLRHVYEPEDIVHDAWLVALPRLAELPQREGRHTPVLLRFLSTTILQRVRNLKRKHNASIGRRPEESTRSDPVALAVASQSGIVSQAVRREMENEVRRALAELRPDDREVILLRGIEQVTNETAGIVLGVSAAAVSKRYSRALEKLRRRMPGSVFDELSES